ncbi:hypothetical protein S83_021275 [Arachis hypogaea]|uniref:Uncharacterized protein n=1 Tax=Arachis hypogaea TaxID=3818 RepID=A0A444YWM4_ARAHY|nr:uncharacterized protein DS421_16g562820 [Arachis hypogaea]RYR06335.1 hypothetical protein Ahy_B06g086085 [Arachis hypogaea]
MALTSLSSKSCATFWLFLLLGNVASATLFTLHNNCKYTVWPGTLSGNNPTILDTGLWSPPQLAGQDDSGVEPDVISILLVMANVPPEIVPVASSALVEAFH